MVTWVVETQEIVTWKVATWEIFTWEVSTWEIVTWEVAFGKVPNIRELENLSLWQKMNGIYPAT